MSLLKEFNACRNDLKKTWDNPAAQRVLSGILGVQLVVFGASGGSFAALHRPQAAVDAAPRVPAAPEVLSPAQQAAIDEKKRLLSLATPDTSPLKGCVAADSLVFDDNGKRFLLQNGVDRAVSSLNQGNNLIETEREGVYTVTLTSLETRSTAVSCKRVTLTTKEGGRLSFIRPSQEAPFTLDSSRDAAVASPER